MILSIQIDDGDTREYIRGLIPTNVYMTRGFQDAVFTLQQVEMLYPDGVGVRFTNESGETLYEYPDLPVKHAANALLEGLRRGDCSAYFEEHIKPWAEQRTPRPEH
jgi:hypothetical protein